MTCIVALKDMENKCVWMGADSCVSTAFMERIMEQQKVFVLQDTRNVLMGMAGGLRDINVLSNYPIVPHPHYDEFVNTESIITSIIPLIKATMDVTGRESEVQGVESAMSNMILASGEDVWMITGDYSVVSFADSDFICIGSGSEYAMGALEILQDEDMDVKDKVAVALSVATKYAQGVSAPYIVKNTLNNEVYYYGDENVTVYEAEGVDTTQ